MEGSLHGRPIAKQGTELGPLCSPVPCLSNQTRAFLLELPGLRPTARDCPDGGQGGHCCDHSPCCSRGARLRSLRPPHAPTALAAKGPGAANLLMVNCETP